MKKNIYIVLLGLLLSIGFVSCDNSTDLLFDESAAQRKAGANKAYNEAFKSSEKGWLFQYFPEETQKYGGYNFVLKFAEKGQVTVWSENMTDLTKPETSMYDVISYGGPVLTFNTYNSIMHEFANPSSAEYLGKGGDYEFLIISHENDVITLKGIKTGNTMRLVKLTETAEKYFSKTKVVSDFIQGAAFGTVVNNTEVDIFLSGRQLTFNYKENSESKSDKIAFIYTDKGIRLYEPITILGVTVQDFVLNTETKQLISTNGDMTVSVIFPPIDLTANSWIVTTGVEAYRSDAVKAAWDVAYAENDKAYPGEVLTPNFVLGKAFRGNGFLIQSDKYTVVYLLNFSGVMGNPNHINITQQAGGTNWRWYAHLKPFVNLITDNAPYTVVMDNADTPTQVKMTSVANPDVWFILRK